MNSNKGYISPWLKSSSQSSSTSRNDSSSKFLPSPNYSKTSANKSLDSKSVSKYNYNSSLSGNSASSSAYQGEKARNLNSGPNKLYDKSELASRYKNAIEKNDTLSPSRISYRPLKVAESKSRDPSAEKETSSGSYGFKHVYSPGGNRSFRSPISRERSKDDLLNSYRSNTTSSSSKEDVRSDPNKYITSRFLPKNTIEKSHTAYIRPVSTRIASNQRETSRKNREILNLIHVQHNESNRSSERTSSSNNSYKISENKVEEIVTVNVISRATSPTCPTPNSIPIHSNRVGLTKLMEKQISRPIRLKAELIDKQIQCEQTFPNKNKGDISPSKNTGKLFFESGSEKCSSRNSSTKSTSSSKSELSKDSKSLDENKSIKKFEFKKQLPPHIPTTNSKAQVNQQNKDFRKSVLNMNFDTKTAKFKSGKITDSQSSIDSESNVETNNKTSTTESKLPKRSNSSLKYKSNKTVSDGSGTERDILKKRESSQGSNSSSCSDNEKNYKSIKKSGSGSEAKSFLMRALAPVTNFFKNNNQNNFDSNEKSDWLVEDNTLWDVESEIVYDSKYNEDKTLIEDDNLSFSGAIEEPSLKDDASSSNRKINSKCEEKTEIGHKITHIRSGEKPWWLESSSENEENKERRFNKNSSIEDNTNVEIIEREYPHKYKIRHIDSGERAWWLNSHEDIPEELKSNQEENIKSDFESVFEYRTSCGSILDEQLIPLGDRASPEGLENPNTDTSGRISPYDNVPRTSNREQKSKEHFISQHTNIDDLLGKGIYSLSPIIDRIFSYQGDEVDQGCSKFKHKWKSETNSDDRTSKFKKEKENDDN